MPAKAVAVADHGATLCAVMGQVLGYLLTRKRKGVDYVQTFFQSREIWRGLGASKDKKPCYCFVRKAYSFTLVEI